MDLLIEREIQLLISSEKGDPLRIKIILESLQKGKKLYKSDEKYIHTLLLEHSKLDEITERIEFLNSTKPVVSEKKIIPKETTRPVLHFQERWCRNCKKGVFPERQFSLGALIILLIIGILPGLIYYALISKKCPICNRSDWGPV